MSAIGGRRTSAGLWAPSPLLRLAVFVVVVAWPAPSRSSRHVWVRPSAAVGRSEPPAAVQHGPFLPTANELPSDDTSDEVLLDDAPFAGPVTNGCIGSGSGAGGAFPGRVRARVQREELLRGLVTSRPADL